MKTIDIAKVDRILGVINDYAGALAGVKLSDKERYDLSKEIKFLCAVLYEDIVAEGAKELGTTIEEYRKNNEFCVELGLVKKED